MIEHIWSVLCQSGAIDAESNRLSLFNVVEGFAITKIPVEVKRFPMALELFSSWTKTDSDNSVIGSMRMRMMFPSGEYYENKLKLHVDLSEHIFYHTRVHLQGFELRGPGVYQFIVELQKDGSEEWKQVAKLPVSIEFVTVETSEAEGVIQEQ